MQVGDTIEYAKVIDGLSNLQRPAVAKAPSKSEAEVAQTPPAEGASPAAAA